MKLIIIFFLNLVLITNSYAGGAFIYEIAAPDNGWSSAGRAANANDSSTVFGNPAGLSNLDKVELMIGIQPKYYNASFNTESENVDLTTWLPDASIFWATRIKKDFHFGLGLLSFMGLGLDYGDDWVGNQYVTKTGIITLDLNPAFSYRAEKYWYIGMGLDLLWGKFLQEFNASSPLNKKVELSDGAFGFGWNLGILWLASKTTRVGAKYRSQAKFDFEFELENISQKPGLTMYIPQEAMLSVYSELGKAWTLMASLGWQNWSKFGNMSITIGSFNDIITLNLNDTWHASIGAKVRLGEKSEIAFGLAYDTSAADDEYRTLVMPFEAQMRASLGYLISNLSFNFTWIGLGTAPVIVSQINRPTIKGDFNPNTLYSLGANYNWKW
jgi:long-chain fatty acid transport protein